MKNLLNLCLGVCFVTTQGFSSEDLDPSKNRPNLSAQRNTSAELYEFAKTDGSYLYLTKDQVNNWWNDIDKRFMLGKIDSGEAKLIEDGQRKYEFKQTDGSSVWYSEEDAYNIYNVGTRNFILGQLQRKK